MPGRERDDFEQQLTELQAIMGAAEQPTSGGARHFVEAAPEQRGFLLPLKVPRGGDEILKRMLQSKAKSHKDMVVERKQSALTERTRHDA
jgi:hypothetical protein